MSVDLNTYMLLAIAVFNAIAAYFSWQAKQIVTQAKDVVVATQSVIQVLEKNTNSIKDALVASTDKAARAEGMAEGKIQGNVEGRLAAVAEGKT